MINQLQDRIAIARELRQAADDIAQGRFDLDTLSGLCASHAGLVKSRHEKSDRTTQLIHEWFERMEERLKVSTDMLDQAQVLRQTAEGLEANRADFDEVSSVLAALAYAYGFDYGYQRFMK